MHIIVQNLHSISTEIANMLTQWEFNIKMGEDRIQQIIIIKDANRN